MATVYQRNGTFYAKFVDENGTRTSRNTGAKKKPEAQLLAAGMECASGEIILGEEPLLMPHELISI